MKTPSPALMDRATLLDRSVAAGLLTPSQRARVEGSLLPEVHCGQRAAQHLVRAGLLTRFQAERLLAGRTDGFVIGQYRIEELIGKGPGGHVYRARHRTMNRLVAIKVLAPAWTHQPEARTAFHEGVRAAAQIQHSHVVTTYDAHERGDRFYVVREFVDGPSLQHVVEQHGPRRFAEAWEWVAQAAQGLHHAHEQGLGHGNLSPVKLLLGRPTATFPRGQVKITDFGMAWFVSPPQGSPPEPTPRPGPRVDANPYTAPERTATAEPDAPSDLFSLGAVFHFLLTGHPPCPGGSETLESRTDVPARARAAIRTLLARDPRRRFPGVPVFLEQLHDLMPPTPLPCDSHSEINFDLPDVSHPHDSLAAGHLTGIPAPKASPWSDILVPPEKLACDTLTSTSKSGTLLAVPRLPRRSAAVKSLPPSSSSSSTRLPRGLLWASLMVVLALIAIGALLR